MAISLAPLLAMLNAALTSSTASQVMTTMTYVGQFAMESMLSADFYNLNDDSTFFYAWQNHLTLDTNAQLWHYTYTIKVDAINPNFAGSPPNLSDAAANVTTTASQSEGTYKRIHVTVENDILPQKTLEFWAIVTPAGQGY